MEKRLPSTLLLSVCLKFPRSKWDKNNTKNCQSKERCKGKNEHSENVWADSFSGFLILY